MPPAKRERKGERRPQAQTQAPTTLGTAIKLRRTELGLSRRDLAERSGLSYPYVAELENGAKQGSPRALEAIAMALELRPSELLAWSDDLQETRGMSPSDPQHWRNVRPPPMPDTIAMAHMEAAPPQVSAAAALPPASAGGGPLHTRNQRTRGLAARVRDVLRGTDPAEAEEALLMVLGEERVREIVRDELGRRDQE